MNTGILVFIKSIAPPLLFFGGIIMLFLVLLKGKINLCLMLLIPLFPLQNVVEKLYQFPLGNQYLDIMLILIVFAWFLKNFYLRRDIFVSTPFNKILIIMAIYTFFSLWHGSSYLGLPPPLSPADERVQNWKNYMILPLIFFIVVNNIKNTRQIKLLFWAMLFSVLLVIFYTGKQMSWMPGLASREKITGTFVWAGINVVAAFFVQFICILLGIFLVHKQKRYRLILGTLIWLGIYIVLFLYSRGAYAALLMGFIAISLLKKRILIIPLLLLFFFWQAMLPPRVVERINQTETEEGTLDKSTMGRLRVWQASVDLFKQYPVTGVGFGVFPYLGYELGDTHNMFLKILVEQGVLGMMFFLILFWLALKSGWMLYRKSQDTFLKGLGLGFAICVIATATVNFFGDRWTYLQIGVYYWAFLGLVARGNIIVQEELENRNSKIINKKR
jgi:O-antigen ligase